MYIIDWYQIRDHISCIYLHHHHIFGNWETNIAHSTLQQLQNLVHISHRNKDLKHWDNLGEEALHHFNTVCIYYIEDCLVQLSRFCNFIHVIHSIAPKSKRWELILWHLTTFLWIKLKIIFFRFQLKMIYNKFCFCFIWFLCFRCVFLRKIMK